jgi:flagellin
MSSGITLSAATRQNLLVAQGTADLLSTTQNLATGKKVNSALDNPTSFFTSQGLNSRSSDLSNLLDSISNGVQAIQAANTGITSIQKLVDSAKSVANQALQATIGYSTKSNVSTTIAGATASDLRGTTAFTSAQATSNPLITGAAGGATGATSGSTLGGISTSLVGTAAKAGDGAANLAGTLTLLGASAAGTIAANATPQDGDTLSVNGKTITFKTGAVGAATVPAGSGTSGNIVTDGSGNSTIYMGTSGTPTATVSDVLNAIDVASGVQKVAISAGAATLTNSSGTNAAISAGGVLTSISGKADFLKGLGLTAATGTGVTTVTQARQTSSATVSSLIQDGSTLNVNGKTISFKNAAPPAAANVASGSGVSGNLVTDGSGNSTVYLQGATIADTLKAIDLATGVQTTSNANGAATLTTSTGMTASSIVSGSLKISTGTTADLSITGTGNAMASLGLAGNTGTVPSFTASRTSAPGGLAGQTLNFGSLNKGTAVAVTFGDGTNGTVKTLDDLNTKLSANNLAATLDANGKLTIQTTNDFASSTIGSTADGGAISGTAASLFTAAAAPVADTNSQNARKSLLTQFNQILDNIKTTAQDSSFNGVNLLNGDTLKMTFNEKGTSTLSLQGVDFGFEGLGLSKLGQNAVNEFEDNSSTNKVIDTLSKASSQLRSQASTFGSNLSVVQNRQDFNKNIINVLQTGSSKLTDADLNEEAANSQALSTRNSLTISALGLANQAQQSVLQLLR